MGRKESGIIWVRFELLREVKPDTLLASFGLLLRGEHKDILRLELDARFSNFRVRGRDK